MSVLRNNGQVLQNNLNCLVNNQLRFWSWQTTSANQSRSVVMNIKNGQQVVVDWGDGFIQTLTGTGNNVTYSRTYVSIGIYSINFLSGFTNITRWQVSTNQMITGSLSNRFRLLVDLEHFVINANPNITGSFNFLTSFTKLITLDLFAGDTLFSFFTFTENWLLPSTVNFINFRRALPVGSLRGVLNINNIASSITRLNISNSVINVVCDDLNTLPNLTFCSIPSLVSGQDVIYNASGVTETLSITVQNSESNFQIANTKINAASSFAYIQSLARFENDASNIDPVAGGGFFIQNSPGVKNINGWINLKNRTSVFLQGSNSFGDVMVLSGGTFTQFRAEGCGLNGSAIGFEMSRNLTGQFNVTNNNIEDVYAIYEDIFNNRLSHNNTTNKIIITTGNLDTVTGVVQGDLGTFAGNVHNLTETEINNLVDGLDFDGNGSNTPWTTGNKVWALSNLQISSVNTTLRYRWIIAL